ncbi:hypothetical protein [Helicobacter labacensis]|uniref:hypothetical protein n=1 Tax=Helicobacter labacensis TaxID=2316079 RepID=UPI000EB31A76|nr:hypothetical protein [Helicobacter labacensis]
MKLAKFVLHCDNHRVGSLEELREHFDILDVLEHYKSNTLQRWLRSRALQSELEQVLAINATSDVEIILALCQIFSVGVEKEDIEAVLKSQQALANKQAQLEKYQGQQTELEKLIRKLIQEAIEPSVKSISSLNVKLKPHQSYYTLKDDFLNAPDLESGRMILVELLNNYFEELSLDTHNVMDKLAIKHKKSLWKGEPKHYPALLLYFFASPMFQENEGLEYPVANCYFFSKADFMAALSDYEIRHEGRYYEPKQDTMFVYVDSKRSWGNKCIKISDDCWFNILVGESKLYLGSDKETYYELPALKA